MVNESQPVELLTNKEAEIINEHFHGFFLRFIISWDMLPHRTGTRIP